MIGLVVFVRVRLSYKYRYSIRIVFPFLVFLINQVHDHLDHCIFLFRAALGNHERQAALLTICTN